MFYKKNVKNNYNASISTRATKAAKTTKLPAYKVSLGKNLYYFCLLFLFISSTANAAFSFDPELTWKTLHTEHFNIHFHDDEESLAKETALIAERVHKRISNYFIWIPLTPTDVVLTDRTDFSNGSATPFPHNQMILYVTPPDDLNTVEDFNNWLEILIIHEYTHIIHLDKASNAIQYTRNIFGRFFPWLFPNALQPLWEIEGIATYMETNNTIGVGRGQSSLFKALMRKELDVGLKPLRQVNQLVTSWPAGTTRYLYGVYFFQFIRDRYGEYKIRELVNQHSRHFIPYMINTTTKRVLNKDLDELWAEFETYLKEIFDYQIDTIRTEGIRAGTQLTFTNYQTTQPRAAPNGDLYFYQNDNSSEPKIMQLKTVKNKSNALNTLNKKNEAVIFADQIHTGRFDIHPQAGILVAQLDAVRNVNIFSDLYQIDIQTKKKTRLTTGSRYRFATWSPDGKNIIAVKNHAGNSSLVLLDKTGKKIKTLWQGKNKEVISSIDWSPNGETVVASVWRSKVDVVENIVESTAKSGVITEMTSVTESLSTGYWNLELFTIADKSWKKLIDSANIETHPQFDATGNTIVFTADYDEIYNIHKFDLKTKRITRLTNLIGGAQHPTLNTDGTTLYYAGLGAEGYNIFKLNLNNESSISEELNLSPSETIEKELTTQTTNIKPNIDMSFKPSVEVKSTITAYSPLESVKPSWWVPHLLVEDDRVEVGLFTGGSDALRRHIYFLLAGYDTKNDLFIGDFNYIYDRWNPTVKIRIAKQSNIFRDSSGNFLRLRSANTLTAEFVFPLNTFDEQWGLHTAAVIEKNKDERSATGVFTASDFTDSLAGIALTYNSTKRFPISISRNNGRRVKFIIENNDAFGGNFSGNIYTLNWQEFIPLGNQHLIALEFTGGYGTKTPRSFRLGGNFSEDYANPLFQATDILFNKRKYALRGYPEGLPGLRGRRMMLGNAEWRFPITSVERGIMMPLPLGIHQVYGNVFFDLAEAWFDSSDRRSFRTATGFEVTAEVVFGYSILFKVRFGFAHGMKDDGGNNTYLTIGSSF